MLSYFRSIVKRGFWIVLLAWVYIIANINALFGGHYTQDSYAFYLLGKSIMEGHGYISPAIRDFYLDPAGSLASRSYPPLFPVLVGITDFVLNESIAAGPVINFFICMFALYLWFLISKRISNCLFFIPFLLPILHSLLPPMSLWVDATVGRSAVLTWPLFLATIHLLSKSSLLTDNKISVAVGFFLGLLTLARFDTLMFCFALPAIIFFTTSISIKKTLLMYATLIVVMLPWGMRNFIIFGSFLASDNTITATSTLSGILQLNFYADGMPLIKDNPKLWITQRFSYLQHNAWFLYSLLTDLTRWIAVSTPAAALVKVVALLYIPGFIFSFIVRKEIYPLWIYFVVSLAWCVFTIACISLTSYGGDPRYLVVSMFAIIGGGSFFIAFIIQKTITLIFKKAAFQTSKTNSGTTIIIELTIFLVFVFFTINYYSKELFYNKADYFWQWTKHIEKTPVKKGELVAAKEAEIISFHTGWNTIYLPLNTPQFDSNYQAWLTRWKPSYLIVDLYDFNSSLTTYPRASVLTILDTVVLLKINLDETVLTEKDKADNAKNRHLWKQQILSKIPPRDAFFADIYSYKKGIATQGDGFVVQNTPDHQLAFANNRVVLLPNGEQRLIVEIVAERHYWHVKVLGGPISDQFSVLPDTFKTIDSGSPFFVTNETFARGVARQWAGFIIQNTAANQQRYKVGYTVQLPTGDKRTITKITNDAAMITVYLAGDPIDGFKVGTPDHFEVRPQ